MISDALECVGTEREEAHHISEDHCCPVAEVRVCTIYLSKDLSRLICEVKRACSVGGDGQTGYLRRHSVMFLSARHIDALYGLLTLRQKSLLRTEPSRMLRRTLLA